MSDDRYQLIDFGGGRKLESLAGHLVDRPAPAAEGMRRRNPRLWREADSYFDRERKVWRHRAAWPAPLTVDCGRFRMPLTPTPFGHIGLFPEQADNWQWLSQPVATGQTPRQGLNLFGYTGASTMAMVVGGLAVAHVDAAKPNVNAARAAAELNGFENRTIRYLVDDAGKFVARELRRGNRYHTIVLDPPAFGHAGSGKTWRLERDLWPLIDDCLQLVEHDSFRLLITGHSPQVGQDQVLGYLQQNRIFHDSIDPMALRHQTGRSQLVDPLGRGLDSGFFVRIEKQPAG